MSSQMPSSLPQEILILQNASQQTRLAIESLVSDPSLSCSSVLPQARAHLKVLTRLLDDTQLAIDEQDDDSLRQLYIDQCQQAAAVVKKARACIRQASLKQGREALLSHDDHRSENDHATSGVQAAQGILKRRNRDQQLMNQGVKELTQNITLGLYNVTQLVQQEVNRTNAASEVLEDSTNLLKKAKEEFEFHQDDVEKGKQKLKQLNRSQKVDGAKIKFALIFFFAVVAFIITRRLFLQDSQRASIVVKSFRLPYTMYKSYRSSVRSLSSAGSWLQNRTAQAKAMALSSTSSPGSVSEFGLQKAWQQTLGDSGDVTKLEKVKQWWKSYADAAVAAAVTATGKGTRTTTAAGLENMPAEVKQWLLEFSQASKGALEKTKTNVMARLKSGDLTQSTVSWISNNVPKDIQETVLKYLGQDVNVNQPIASGRLQGSTEKIVNLPVEQMSQHQNKRQQYREDNVDKEDEEKEERKGSHEELVDLIHDTMEDDLDVTNSPLYEEKVQRKMADSDGDTSVDDEDIPIQQSLDDGDEKDRQDLLDNNDVADGKDDGSQQSLDDLSDDDQQDVDANQGNFHEREIIT